MDRFVDEHGSYRAISSSDYDFNSAFEHELLSHQQDYGLGDKQTPRDGQEVPRLIPRKPVPGDVVSKVSDFADPAKNLDFVGVSTSPSENRWKLESARIWWLEIVSCLLSIAACIAIIATLWSYRAKPLPEWPYHLTINTLLSIYVVILKAALLLVATQGMGQLKWRWYDTERPLSDISTFDEATRGPWGSLALLWMLKGRSLIASAGAFVVLAVLFVEPFAQQVVSPYQCNLTVLDSTATIPRTNYFVDVHGVTEGLGHQISIELRDSINAGIFNPGLQVPFNCPSGNCDYAELYHSVGYCSSCNDTTDSLVVSTGLNYDDQSPWVNISLPGYWPDDRDWERFELPFDWVPPQALIVNSSALIYELTSLLMDYFTGAVVASTINKSYSCSGDMSSHWGCNQTLSNCTESDLCYGYYGAAYCNLRPCVKSYRSKIRSGLLLEEIVSTNDIWAWNNYNYQAPSIDYDYPYIKANINKACLSQETQHRLSNLNSTREVNGWFHNQYLAGDYDGDSDIQTGTYWISTPDDASINNISIPTECVYAIHGATETGIEKFLIEYLSGNVSKIDDGEFNDEHQYGGTTQMLNIYNEGSISFYDLDKIFTNISNSMTWYIRQNGYQDFSTPALGKVLSAQTCIHVRWAWLIYPAVLVVLTLLFLIATILNTCRGERKDHDWKSEALALMLNGLDDEAFSHIAATRLIKTRDMHQAAKLLNVRLVKQGSGWAFTTTSRHSE